MKSNIENDCLDTFIRTTKKVQQGPLWHDTYAGGIKRARRPPSLFATMAQSGILTRLERGVLFPSLYLFSGFDILGLRELLFIRLVWELRGYQQSLLRTPNKALGLSRTCLGYRWSKSIDIDDIVGCGV